MTERYLVAVVVNQTFIAYTYWDGNTFSHIHEIGHVVCNWGERNNTDIIFTGAKVRLCIVYISSIHICILYIYIYNIGMGYDKSRCQNIYNILKKKAEKDTWLILYILLYNII